MNPDVYSTSSKIPKQFADVLYSEIKKLCVINFVGKYEQRFLENKKGATYYIVLTSPDFPSLLLLP